METHNPLPLLFLETHLTVQIAAEISGYNAQYLRRLLRAGTLNGDKIGQVWLIRKTSLEKYLKKTQCDNDQRFGPKQWFDE
jgi:excisionase family DNA binding protein